MQNLAGLKMTLKIKSGEVWLANLNPSRGTEPGKMRPVLIIQNQALLDAGHPSTLIVPLTTKLVEGAEPLRLRIKAKEDLKKDSDLLIDQIRAVDNKRLISGPLLSCSNYFMEKVFLAISEVIGMDNQNV